MHTCGEATSACRNAGTGGQAHDGVQQQLSKVVHILAQQRRQRDVHSQGLRGHSAGGGGERRRQQRRGGTKAAGVSPLPACSASNKGPPLPGSLVQVRSTRAVLPGWLAAPPGGTPGAACPATHTPGTSGWPCGRGRAQRGTMGGWQGPAHASCQCSCGKPSPRAARALSLPSHDAALPWKAWLALLQAVAICAPGPTHTCSLPLHIRPPALTGSTERTPSAACGTAMPRSTRWR